MCGHKIEEVTPKQIGDEHGRKRKEKKADRRKRAWKKPAEDIIAREGFRRGKTKEQKQNKPGQPHIICVGQERQPYTYINYSIFMYC